LRFLIGLDSIDRFVIFEVDPDRKEVLMTDVQLTGVNGCV
jgi:hypothetical protein